MHALRRRAASRRAKVTESPSRGTWWRANFKARHAGNAGWDTFEEFLADIGPRPSTSHFLEAVHGWTPGGVRWSTWDSYAQSRPACKLTAHDVRTIRRRVRSGSTQASVARDFAISPSMVSRIVHYQKWRKPGRRVT